MLRSLMSLFPIARKNESGARAAAAARRGTFRPGLEGLEGRVVPSSAPLHVAGNQFQDTANNAVVLRGVNVISLEWRPDGDNVAQAVTIAINDWHANLLRLPVNQDFWFGHNQAWTGGESGDGGAAYRARVDQVVSTAGANNVYVLLDLHWSDMGVWGSSNGQHFLPDDLSTAFWQDAAPRYANNPAVLFDPYNEPHFANDRPTDADFALWQNGGSVHETGEFSGTYHSPGMQGLVNTIRAAGANNLVAPEGLNWGSNLTGVYTGHALADPAGSLLYQTHLYPNKLADAEVAASVEAVANNYPIYVGEWGSGGVVGQPDGNAAASNRQLLAYLDGHPNFSWTAWALTPDLGEDNLLTAWNANSTTSDYGSYVKANLAGHVGNPTLPPDPIAYTPDTVFKVGDYWIDVPASYDATHRTPTELFVWSHGCGGESQYDIYNVAPRAGGPTYVAITIDGREGGCWDMGADPAKVLAAIADVKTHFNIDPQRVVLGGYSSGGDLSYRVAFTHSTEIAGVLAENTSPFRDTGLARGQALAAPFHFHVVHLAHTEDTTYPINLVRSETDAVKAAGSAGDGWDSLLRIERHGSHWDNDHWDDSYGYIGTNYDLMTYLLPHLGDGWRSPAANLNATAAFEVREDWGSGFTGYITLTNTGNTPINGWTLEFNFSGNIGNIPDRDIWSAEMVSHSGDHYVIRNAWWNATIAPGQSIAFGFNADWADPQAGPTNFVLNGTAIGA